MIDPRPKVNLLSPVTGHPRIHGGACSTYYSPVRIIRVLFASAALGDWFRISCGPGDDTMG